MDAASIYLIKFIPCTQVKGQFHGGLGQIVKNCVLAIPDLVKFSVFSEEDISKN